MQEISLNGYQTVKPIVLFYRDPLECIQVLLRNPIFEGKWSFSARRVYKDPDQQNRVYNDWMTSDGAWSAQVRARLTLFTNPALTVSPVYSSTRWNPPWRHALFGQNEHIGRNRRPGCTPTPPDRFKPLYGHSDEVNVPRSSPHCTAPLPKIPQPQEITSRGNGKSSNPSLP